MRHIAFGAPFSGSTGFEGGQVDIEPEPLVVKRMAKDLPHPAQGRFVGASPLGDLERFTGVQDAGDGRLFGKLLAAPGLREEGVATNGRIDLGHDFAPSQQSDRQIQQGLDRKLGMCRLWELHPRPHRRPQIEVAHPKTQGHQGGVAGTADRRGREVRGHPSLLLLPNTFNEEYTDLLSL